MKESLSLLLDIVLTKLTFCLVSLDKETDPYEIFESINMSQCPLKQSDLIRNHVFWKMDKNDQKDL